MALVNKSVLRRRFVELVKIKSIDTKSGDVTIAVFEPTIVDGKRVKLANGNDDGFYIEYSLNLVVSPMNTEAGQRTGKWMFALVDTINQTVEFLPDRKKGA